MLDWYCMLNSSLSWRLHRPATGSITADTEKERKEKKKQRRELEELLIYYIYIKEKDKSWDSLFISPTYSQNPTLLSSPMIP
jgi:hypothetical protein